MAVPPLLLRLRFRTGFYRNSPAFPPTFAVNQIFRSLLFPVSLVSHQHVSVRTQHFAFQRRFHRSGPGRKIGRSQRRKKTDEVIVKNSIILGIKQVWKNGVLFAPFRFLLMILHEVDHSGRRRFSFGSIILTIFSSFVIFLHIGVSGSGQ